MARRLYQHDPRYGDAPKVADQAIPCRAVRVREADPLWWVGDVIVCGPGILAALMMLSLLGGLAC